MRVLEMETEKVIMQSVGVLQLTRYVRAGIHLRYSLQYKKPSDYRGFFIALRGVCYAFALLLMRKLEKMTAGELRNVGKGSARRFRPYLDYGYIHFLPFG